VSSRSRRAGLAAVPLAAALALGGCGVGTPRPARTPTAPATTTAAPRPAVYFLGDSYTVGVNETPTSRTYASVLARWQGWRTAIAGYPFAGFVHRDKHDRDYADLFRRKLAAHPAPRMLVIAGAHNDRRESARRIRLKASLLLAGVHRYWPRTRLVVVGPMWGGDPTPGALRVRGAVRSAAHAHRVPFIDPLGERWITGDPEKGTGNAARYVLPDHTHPTTAGHRHMARRLRTDLTNRRLLPS